jgi:hypothetical protein
LFEEGALISMRTTLHGHHVALLKCGKNGAVSASRFR